MKRSEMVNVLADFLAANYDETWLEKKDHVSAILNLLEVEGMLPPSRWRKHDWNERGITYSDWLMEPSRVNEWEEE